MEGLRERIRRETDQKKRQDLLWSELILREGQNFYTVKGLEYTYHIRGNEMFVSRKTKSITKASVDLALEKIIELEGMVTGPKKLECFGASYLYPVFIEMGLIESGRLYDERKSAHGGTTRRESAFSTAKSAGA